MSIETEAAYEKSYYDRIDSIASGYADDVRMIQKLADGNGGAAKVSRQLLGVLNCKRGAVDLIELRHLDFDHRAAAMRLIELCANPSYLPDSGLSSLPDVTI